MPAKSQHAILTTETVAVTRPTSLPGAGGQRGAFRAQLPQCAVAQLSDSLTHAAALSLRATTNALQDHSVDKEAACRQACSSAAIPEISNAPQARNAVAIRQATAAALQPTARLHAAVEISALLTRCVPRSSLMWLVW